MGDKKEYIERGAFLKKCAEAWGYAGLTIKAIEGIADECTAADVVEVEKVAEMLRAMFDDDCACNYNGNDEWLPHVCEYGCTECPDAPEENGCWKQFVKHFLAKMDGERKEQT